MYWYDTHTHLTDEAFDSDGSDCLLRAAEAGIGSLNLIGWDWESSAHIVDWVRAHSCESQAELYAVVGVHPHSAEEWTEDIRASLGRLLDEASLNRIVAVGEIGLDYHYENAPREQQKLVFRAQLELAHEYDLPVVIHDRDAHADTLDLLLEAKKCGLIRSQQPGVIHCYSGSWEMAQAFLKLGFYLGFDGPVTYKNARHAVEVVSSIPLDRLLLETDCPYLPPVPYRGKRNEPAYLPIIGERIAQIRGMTPQEICDQTTENARRLFACSFQE